jgi:hypothetical protein
MLDADFFVSEKFKIYFFGFMAIATVFPIKIRDRPGHCRSDRLNFQSRAKSPPVNISLTNGHRQNFRKISAKFPQNFCDRPILDPHYPPDVATYSKTGYVQISINSQGLLL